MSNPLQQLLEPLFEKYTTFKVQIKDNPTPTYVFAGINIQGSLQINVLMFKTITSNDLNIVNPSEMIEKIGSQIYLNDNDLPRKLFQMKSIQKIYEYLNDKDRRVIRISQQYKKGKIVIQFKMMVPVTKNIHDFVPLDLTLVDKNEYFTFIDKKKQIFEQIFVKYQEYGRLQIQRIKKKQFIQILLKESKQLSEKQKQNKLCVSKLIQIMQLIVDNGDIESVIYDNNDRQQGQMSQWQNSLSILKYRQRNDHVTQYSKNNETQNSKVLQFSEYSEQNNNNGQQYWISNNNNNEIQKILIIDSKSQIQQSSQLILLQSEQNNNENKKENNNGNNNENNNINENNNKTKNKNKNNRNNNNLDENNNDIDDNNNGLDDQYDGQQLQVEQMMLLRQRNEQLLDRLIKTQTNLIKQNIKLQTYQNYQAYSQNNNYTTNNNNKTNNHYYSFKNNNYYSFNNNNNYSNNKTNNKTNNNDYLNNNYQSSNNNQSLNNNKNNNKNISKFGSNQQRNRIKQQFKKVQSKYQQQLQQKISTIQLLKQHFIQLKYLILSTQSINHNNQSNINNNNNNHKTNHNININNIKNNNKIKSIFNSIQQVFQSLQ